jgi:hypothetical protein
MARAPDLAHLTGHLQSRLSRGGYGLAGDQLRSKFNGFLNIEGFVAAPAEGVVGSVLHQPAMLAPHNFAGIHTKTRGCHRLVAERQSGGSGVLFLHRECSYCVEMNHNCQVKT